MTKLSLSVLPLFLFLTMTAFGQDIMEIKGTVTDAKTNEPLPFVNISFVGTSIGTTTDFDGKYTLRSQWGSKKVQASFVGYDPITKNLSDKKKQHVDFKLASTSKELEEFQVVGKRRYRNKDNPAVALIKNVIKNKKKNRKEALAHYEYDKYEKIELDLNNITPEYLNKKAFKKFKFIGDYVDTSEVNGKPFLPIFFKETASKVYYRKDPTTFKEYEKGNKLTGFAKYLDDDGISFLMDKLYEDVDIYDNKIFLMSKEFISPISGIAPTIYKFFIIDTVEVVNRKCIQLAFVPRNKLEYAFKGDLFIACDSTYAVIKASMGVDPNININFINDIKIEQEFTQFNDTILMCTRDEMVVDYALTETGVGMFGTKIVHASNHDFNVVQPDSIYAPLEKVVKVDKDEEKDEEFWNSVRNEELSESEQGVYQMVDSLQNLPAFKRAMDVLMIILSGYIDANKFEIGPINTFFSFNDVEGRRLRFGGRTTNKLFPKVMLEGYAAYGMKDKKWKYFGGITYSFHEDFNENPRHQIQFRVKHETNFPGQSLQFLNEDNILLSFRNGRSDKMIFFDSYYLEYWKELGNGIGFKINTESRVQRPYGILEFKYGADDQLSTIDKITTSTVGAEFRWAVNEQYYQGKKFRVPMINKYPIFRLNVEQGIKGVLNGEYNYTSAKLNIFKRLYIAPFGFADCEVEAGKMFGSVPYPLLFIAPANQSYAYQLRSFNMVQFLEFVSDEYVSIMVQHRLNGFFFNRIPLFKRLKLREVVSFKGVFGNITDANNPAINGSQMRFPTDAANQAVAFGLDGAIPYMEASLGVGNIFKVLRVDAVQRMNYLSNPGVPTLFGVKGLGLRARLRIEF